MRGDPKARQGHRQSHALPHPGSPHEGAAPGRGARKSRQGLPAGSFAAPCGPEVLRARGRRQAGPGGRLLFERRLYARPPDRVREAHERAQKRSPERKKIGGNHRLIIYSRKNYIFIIMDYSQTVSKERIEKAAAALREHGGFEVYIAETGEDAKQRVLSLIPSGAEVMTMTSVTLESIGLTKEINESGKFDSVRGKFAAMDHEKDKAEMRRLGAAPEWAIGSAHAVTETGEVLIASKT